MALAYDARILFGARLAARPATMPVPTVIAAEALLEALLDCQGVLITIDFSPVPDLDHGDRRSMRPVLNTRCDSCLVERGASLRRRAFGTRRTRIGGESFYLSRDPPPVLFRQFLQLFGRRGPDQEPIACHAAASPLRRPRRTRTVPWHARRMQPGRFRLPRVFDGPRRSPIPKSCRRCARLLHGGLYAGSGQDTR